MKSQRQTANLLRCHVKWIERQMETLVRKIVLDGGKTLLSSTKDFELDSIGIGTTAPYSLQESDCAGGMNQSIKKGICQLLIHSDASMSYCTECLYAACDEQNCIARSGSSKSAEELDEGVKTLSLTCEHLSANHG